MRSDKLRLLAPLLLSLALGACGTANTAPPAATAKATQPQVAPAELLRLGALALDQGRADEARKRYGRLLSIEPNNGEAKLGLAESNLALGDVAAASPIFEELSLDPQYGTRAKLGLGLCALAQRQYSSAEAMLTSVTESDPSSWRAWNGLGQMHDAQGQWDKAQVAYGRAIEAAPDSAVALNNRGFSYILQGKAEKAVPILVEALRKSPNLDVAQSNLRLALAMQGRYDDAQSGVAGERLPMVLNNLGYVAMTRGDYPRAEALLVRALETSPTYYETASQNLVQLRNIKKAKEQ